MLLFRRADKTTVFKALTKVYGKPKFYWGAKPASSILLLSRRGTQDSHKFVCLRPIPGCKWEQRQCCIGGFLSFLSLPLPTSCHKRISHLPSLHQHLSRKWWNSPTAFQLDFPFLNKVLFSIISLTNALESPQSLMGKNLQWTFEVYVSNVNKSHPLYGNFSSCHGRENTHLQCMQTH